MSSPRFEQRFVAFVDILGFTNLVGKMSSNERLFVTIRDALEALDRQAKAFEDYSRKCWRSPKTDHLCSVKIDQGWKPAGVPAGGR